jgi:hypothetical protein
MTVHPVTVVAVHRHSLHQAVLTEARLDRSRRGLGRTCEESAEHEAGGERGTKRDHGIPLDENVRQRLKVAVPKEFREQR